MPVQEKQADMPQHFVLCTGQLSWKRVSRVYAFKAKSLHCHF